MSAEFLYFAHALADRAREVSLKFFRRGVAVESKDDASPVTRADRECEIAMREMLADKYPSHAVVGEEFGATGSAELQWVIDPIDGTRSFVTGSPLFCTLIALTRGGIPIVGVIDVPALGERWAAAEGIAAEFNGGLCRASDCKKIADATVTTTTLGWGDASEDSALTRLMSACRTSRLGGDSFNYGCVAAGFADIAVDTAMKPHDFLALAPIVSTAGGVISDWENRPLTLQSGENVIASATSELHHQALRALNNEK